jgi:hypothetical protein
MSETLLFQNKIDLRTTNKKIIVTIRISRNSDTIKTTKKNNYSEIRDVSSHTLHLLEDTEDMLFCKLKTHQYKRKQSLYLQELDIQKTLKHQYQ